MFSWEIQEYKQIHNVVNAEMEVWDFFIKAQQDSAARKGIVSRA